MKRSFRTFLSLGLSLTLSLPAFGQAPRPEPGKLHVFKGTGGVVLEHQLPEGFPDDVNPRLFATFTSPVPMATMVVLFRAVTDEWEKDSDERIKKGWGRYEHYVEMRLDPVTGKQRALLPIPKNGTTIAYYRIIGLDTAGGDVDTGDLQMRVDDEYDIELTDAEKELARELVIGQTGDVQDEIPRGWKCDGVISQIEPDGTLKPAGCGGAFPWWIPVVVGAGAAGAAISSGQDNPVSASRPAGPRRPQ